MIENINKTLTDVENYLLTRQLGDAEAVLEGVINQSVVEHDDDSDGDDEDE